MFLKMSRTIEEIRNERKPLPEQKRFDYSNSMNQNEKLYSKRFKNETYYGRRNIKGSISRIPFTDIPKAN